LVYPQKWCVTAQQDAPNAPYAGFFLVVFLSSKMVRYGATGRA